MPNHDFNSFSNLAPKTLKQSIRIFVPFRISKIDKNFHLKLKRISGGVELERVVPFEL